MLTYNCSRCGEIHDVQLMDSGPHTKVICSKCGQHIKFASPKEVNDIMASITADDINIDCEHSTQVVLIPCPHCQKHIRLNIEVM